MPNNVKHFAIHADDIQRARTFYEKTFGWQFKPWWPPGSQYGYHALTYGFLVGEVIRRVSGRSVGSFVREEIARPLGVEFVIGLTAAEEARVAEIVPLPVPDPAEARIHRHWYHYCSDCALYYDYSYGNVQSPATYIYPAANWGPFFHRVRHYGPIVSYQRPAF